MSDFRLKVFHTVAKRLNFTKAAEELFITQPAVTKHIQELENRYKVKLFERNGTKIKLTVAGTLLVQYCEELFTVYRNLEFDLNTLANQHSGKLKIGASTTVAQYVLPPVLAAFREKFKSITIALTTDNTEKIEAALLNNEIDLGIIEGKSQKPVIKYTKFIKDEIVLVSGIANSRTTKQTLLPEDLKNTPLLLREPGSGTLEVIAHALKSFDIKIAQLNNEMQLSNTESIKLYLLHSSCMAFLSLHSISKELKNKEFQIIDVEGLNIERYFFFIQTQGQPEALSDLFIKFAARYNFK